jgi:hypothetical protein
MDRTTYLKVADGLREGINLSRVLEIVGGCSSWWLGLDEATGDQANREAAAILERLSEEVDQWENN